MKIIRVLTFFMGFIGISKCEKFCKLQIRNDIKVSNKIWRKKSILLIMREIKMKISRKSNKDL